MENSENFLPMTHATKESHGLRKSYWPGRGRTSGFTLVEVVLALGLCSFALLSLMSLMPVSLDSARHALEISRVAKAFQKVASELTQRKFGDIETMSTVSYYFDYEGSTTDAQGNPYTAGSAEKYFTVSAHVEASPIANHSATNLLRVTLEAQTRSESNVGSTTITICDMGY